MIYILQKYLETHNENLTKKKREMNEYTEKA